jgi:xylulokinase
MLGIDAGTSRVRVLVFEMDGSIVAEGSSEPPVHRPKLGWAFTEAEDLWDSCLKAIKMATAKLDKPHRIRSIAVASVGEAAVPLDKKGAPLYPIIAWYDSRTSLQANWLAKNIGKERLFEITGLYPYPFFGLCKQMWIREHENEVYSKTESWLNTADYLAWKLCGVSATDYSLASRTFALDIRSLQYSEDLLDAVKIPRSWYQDLVPSGTFLGSVLPEIAKETHLDNNCSVSSGGHDHFVGAISAGALKHGTLTDSMGTAESLTVFMDQPLEDKRIGKLGYTQGVIYVDKPYYYFDGGFFTSGATVQWFHKLMGNRFTHEELIQEAEKVPLGSHGLLFLPYLKFGSPPNPSESSKGSLLGIGTDTDHTSIYKAILEGMACNVRMIVEGMMKYPQFPKLEKIHCFGGSSKNRLLMQIKASVLNKNLTRLDITESVSLGAAILGGIGAGLFPNFDEALCSIEFSSEEFIPQEEWVKMYENHFNKIFCGAWEQLKPLQDKIIETTSF